VKSLIHRLSPLFLAGLFCVYLPPLLQGQDELLEQEETLEVRLPDGDLYPGQVFVFYLVIEDAQSVSAGEVPESEDFAIRYVDAANTVRDGVKTWALTYEAVPVMGGRLQLPALPVTVDGLEFWNAPKMVTVGVPTPSPQLDLKVTLSQKECYVGEAILLRFEWESRLSLNGIRALQIRVPAITEPRMRVHEPLGLDPKAPGTIGLPVAGRRVIGQFSERHEGETPVSTIVFERILVPREAGTFTVPASTILCSYFKPKEPKFRGSRYPSYFNNDFFDLDTRGEYERLITSSEALSLRVLPLPKEGRPAGFSGTVGAFSAAATAEPRVVEVLEPMTLKVAISGHAYPQTLDIAPLTGQRALSALFRIPDERALPRIVKGARQITQTIRPIHDGVAAVPALHFDYFDPKTRRYGSATTLPMPITVKAARAATAFEADFSDGTTLKSEVVASGAGLRHNRLGEDLLVSEPLANSRGSWLFWLLGLGIPPLLCMVGLHRHSRIEEARLHPERIRSRNAYRHFRAAWPNLSKRDECRRAVETYLCDRLGLARCAAAPDELIASAQMHGAPAAQLGALGDFLESSDWVRFGLDSSTDEEPLSSEDRNQLFESVERLEVSLRRGTNQKNHSGSSAKAGVAALILPTLLIPTQVPALGNEEILARAEALFAEANEVSLRDPAVGLDFYAESASYYEALIDSGLSNAGLHVNLANARFLAGDLGRAILHYRRALLHDPNDAVAREGLAHVRSLRTDVFPSENAGIGARIASLCEAIGTRRLRWGCVFGWALLCGGIYRVGTHDGLLARRILAAGALVTAVCGLAFLGWSATERQHPAGVVVVGESLARKGDGYLYDPAFPNPVHAGAEYRVLELRGSWVHAQFPNGETGWIPATDGELVVDEDPNHRS